MKKGQTIERKVFISTVIYNTRIKVVRKTTNIFRGINTGGGFIVPNLISASTVFLVTIKGLDRDTIMGKAYVISKHESVLEAFKVFNDQVIEHQMLVTKRYFSGDFE